MTTPITASMLYNLVKCPTRPAMDLYENPALKDPVSRFVELLWERGALFEEAAVQSLRIPYTNLKELHPDEREWETMGALARGDPLIYGGRIRHQDLLGEPDLLRRQESGYVAGDIKSGAGEEGVSDLAESRPKKHYAVQLSHYTHILEGLGRSAGRHPFVWDVNGKEIEYDLDVPQGPKTPATLWDLYVDTLVQARQIVLKAETTRPALSSACKLCHWRSACGRTLERLNDLTLVPELGRSKRDVMIAIINDVDALAAVDLVSFVRGQKTVFPRVGATTLRRLQARARLQAVGGQPYLTTSLELPKAETELFFDIETDPMRDVCYLHGFVERRGGDFSSEQYYTFLAEAPVSQDEEEAFSGAFSFVRGRMPCVLYYYSPYERTVWNSLARKYPSVASEADIEDLFASAGAIDLYSDVVRSKTIWPTRDHSIKTLATSLGFNWRDESPSGADSIEWYHRWVETQDASIRRRILEYNEDDCRAMRVLVDALRTMPVRGE